MTRVNNTRARLGGLAVLIVGLVGCGSAETATPATTAVEAEASPRTARAEQLAKLGAELDDAGFGTALPTFRDSLRALAELGTGDDWLATQNAARNVIATGSALYAMAGDAPVGPLATADVVAFSTAIDAVVEASNPLLLCGAASECADDIARAIKEAGRADEAAQHFAGLFG